MAKKVKIHEIIAHKNGELKIDIDVENLENINVNIFIPTG